jgi:cytochrome b
MERTLVWDLPIRLFHWLFAGGFIVAAVIALGLGDDSPLFPYHGMIGLALALMLAMRVIWGVAGSRYARFGSFVYSPMAVVRYLRGAAAGQGEQHAGHNPGSAYAIFAMLAIVAGLAVSGVMLGQGNEGVKEIHELLVYAMIGVAGMHVLGVVLHTLRRHDNIAAGMIHGHKNVAPSAGIRSSHPVAAAVFLMALGAWGAALLAAYDPVTQSTTIPTLGTRLQLGDSHEGGSDERRDDREDD